jgi:putative copper export protein
MDALIPVVQRWLLFSGALIVTGAVAWRALVLPRARFELNGGIPSPPSELPELTRAEARVAGVGAVTSFVLLLAWGLRLYVQVMDFRDPFAPLSEDLAFLVFDTFWGTVWMAQGVVLSLMTTGFLVLRRRAGSTPPPPAGLTPEGIPRAGPRPIELPARWGVVAVAVVALLLTLSLSSHAMSAPYNRPLAVFVDFAHTAAAGAWMGSLALILTNSWRGDGTGRLPAAQLRGFSPVAMGAVGVLVFMGILLSTLHLPAISSLWETRYGRTLGIKVLLALGVLATGFWNWRRGLPAMDQEGGVRSIRRSGLLEVALAALVVLATALLVATPPPPGAH